MNISQLFRRRSAHFPGPLRKPCRRPKQRLASETNRRAGRLRGTAAALLLFAAMTAPVVLVGCSAQNASPLPAEIEGLQFGAPSTAVVEKIKPSGQHAIAPLPKRPGSTLITWTPAANPRYEKIAFEFNENDRLYLIRFTPLKEHRFNLGQLKTLFFTKYSFEGDPNRMRLGDRDVVVYASSTSNLTFFEIRDVKTGEVALELFKAEISRQGRPPLLFRPRPQPGESSREENGIHGG